MNYFATLVFLLLSANGTFLPFFNIDWFLVEVLFIWIGLTYNRFDKRDLRFGGYFMLVYISYCSFRSYFFLNLPIRFYISDIIYLFKYILPSMIYCALLKEKAIDYLSRVIIDLTKISIPLYCIQLVAGDALYNIGNAVAIPPHPPGYTITNFIVFTYIKEHHYQNSGFSWEPGAFGLFLIIGLMMQLFKNGFKIDSGVKWLALGVLTTLSTTSFVALGLVYLMYCRANGVKFSTLAIVAVPVLAVAVVKLPFLLDKVIDIYKHDMRDLQNIEFLSAWYIRRGEEMPFNRFSSLIFIYRQFKWQLILGVSNIFVETVPYLQNANTSSGIFEYFAKFGAVSFVYMLTRAGQFFGKFTQQKELLIYCILLILVLGFSESIFILPLMTNFYFLYFYARPLHEDLDGD
ncbi:hypothetical protein ACFS5N_03870 [Mucilaginibacter ximonensis]|uniref:Uncharacterized protein n=1 Tax=Mucilaginibacter ximonensis TaxID=538021 RepID=A0ABW5Y9C7_9SPHI